MGPPYHFGAKEPEDQEAQSQGVFYSRREALNSVDHNVVILWRILAFSANFWIFSSMKKNVDSGHKIKNKIKTKFRAYFQLYFQWLKHLEVTNNNEICVKLKQKHQFTFYVLVSLWKFDIVKLKRRWYLLSSSIRQSVLKYWVGSCLPCLPGSDAPDNE